MRLVSLRIDGLRNLRDVELAPDPGINVLVGANGAGKTSVLEAVYLLSHGHSFRGGPLDVLQHRDGDGFSVFGEWAVRGGQHRRLGLGRRGGRWTLRVDGDDVRTLGGLVQHCAVTCFDPGAHELISGAAEGRRRFLDWGVFHVEHAFLVAWRRYQRALRQRNALLRAPSEPPAGQYEAWEREMGASGATMDASRRTYLDALEPHLVGICSRLLPELGQPRLTYRRGWPEDMDLVTYLVQRRARDRQRGHSGQGAHRADWTLVFEHAPSREHLSRGQTKLAAMACVLAQAAAFAAEQGEWPLVCLDDLGSELDAAHQEAVIAQLQRHDAQVFVTGTVCPEPLAAASVQMFHVEQGRVAPLL